MPSILLSAASGAPFPIWSGNIWSGQGWPKPVGGVQLRLHPNASGNAYIYLSGNSTSGIQMTINSGGPLLSGASGVGLNDGMIMAPGDSYFVPKLGDGASGVLSIFTNCDAAASGQSRLYWEAF